MICMTVLKNSYNIFWVDAEGTGLLTDPPFMPLEIAAIIADQHGNILDFFDSGTVDATQDHMAHALVAMSDHIWDMSKATGLLGRIENDEARLIGNFDHELARWARYSFGEHLDMRHSASAHQFFPRAVPTKAQSSQATRSSCPLTAQVLPQRIFFLRTPTPCLCLLGIPYVITLTSG